MQAVDDILIIDDEAAIVEFMTDALQDEGYQVRSAPDGQSALAAIAACPPDLVLLDLHLEGMAGTEVLECLRGDDSANIPVVVITADTRAAEQLAAEGLTTCLIKPFSLDELFDCVRRHLRLP